MASVFEYKREAVRVLVMKCEGTMTPECKKFSVDPQITTYEALVSLLAKAFDSKGELRIHYKVFDDYGQETYLPLLSDWDLDAAFIRASEPCLSLRVEIRPYEDSPVIEEEEPISVEAKSSHSLPGFIMNHVEKLSIFSMVQKALNLTDEPTAPSTTASSRPPRSPLRDAEFRTFLDPIGQVINSQDLRSVIYYGGIDPSLRKVVWKHILNVYPDGMSGKERMDYIKAKANEYYALRDRWREMLKNGHMIGDLAYVTGMVRKDVLRTDRHHVFYAGSDDNKNIASLFNILTTYALNHPAVSYCQGMSDLASPLLVTMNDEAHAYICFCALMKRLSPNFLLDGITMTKRFQHLADALLYYDEPFYHYLKSYQADDLLFCYRWLLLEMKREFAFDDALTMLEVMWSSLPPDPPEKELHLFEQEFMKSPPVLSPRPKENAYIKICALRRGVNHHVSLEETRRKPLVKSRPYTSLDDGALRRMDTNATSPNSQQRIVKNLNEFFSLDLKKKKAKNQKEEEEEEQNDRNEKQSPDDASEFEPVLEPPRDVKLDLEKLEKSVLSENEENCKNDEVYVWENPLGTEMSPDGGGNEIKVPPPPQPQTFSISSRYIQGIGDISKPLGLLQRRRVTLEKLSTSNGRFGGAKSAPTIMSIVSKSTTAGKPALPPPVEFGGGNPFLMFLCLTVLTQHRDPIMRQGMDYNEVAMHFDKMVRKHDVTKVLNQARLMYENYVRQFGDDATVSDARNYLDV